MSRKSRFRVVAFPNESRLVSLMNHFLPRAQKKTNNFIFLFCFILRHHYSRPYYLSQQQRNYFFPWPSKVLGQTPKSDIPPNIAPKIVTPENYLQIWDSSATLIGQLATVTIFGAILGGIPLSGAYPDKKLSTAATYTIIHASSPCSIVGRMYS